MGQPTLSSFTVGPGEVLRKNENFSPDEMLTWQELDNLYIMYIHSTSEHMHL